MIHTHQFIFNAFQERCTLIWDDKGFCVIADPGCLDAELDNLVAFIGERKLTPVCILLTHCHFDHIYGIASLSSRYGIPVYMDEKEWKTIDETNPYLCRSFGLPLPEINDRIQFRYVSDGEIIEAGSMRFETIKTPGHSVGGLCFLEREGKLLLSGDTLFAGSIGRTDQPGGDYDALMESIFSRLMCLDGDIAVIPGHGPVTDIATERMTNPFLMPFNEPYEDDPTPSRR